MAAVSKAVNTGWVRINHYTQVRVWIDYEEDIDTYSKCTVSIHPKIQARYNRSSSDVSSNTVYYRCTLDGNLQDATYYGVDTPSSSDGIVDVVNCTNTAHAFNRQESVTTSSIFQFSINEGTTYHSATASTVSFSVVIQRRDSFPSCNLTVESSAPYCVAGSTGTQEHHIYTVKINSVNGGESDFYSVALNVGNKVASTTDINNKLRVGWQASDIPIVGSAVAYRPVVEVRNTSGLSRNYTLDTITVYNHKPPSYSQLSATKIRAWTPPNGTATLYKNYSGCQVSITNVTLYNGCPSATVKMIIGSQTSNTVTVNTGGNPLLQINPLNTANTFTPQLIITDAWGAVYTRDLSTITVSANDPPECTSYEVINIPTDGYYIGGWNGRQYTVNIKSLSPKNNKTIQEVRLKLDTEQNYRSDTGLISITPPSVNNMRTITPQLIIKDVLGEQTVYNLTTVNVYPNTSPPIPSYQVITSIHYAPNNYYDTSADLKTPYTIRLTNIGTSYNKTVTSIKLKFADSSEVTLNNPVNNNTITVYPQTTGSNLSPIITVTDQANATATYTGSIKTTVNSRILDVAIQHLTRITAAEGSAAAKNDEGTQAVITAKFTYSDYSPNRLLLPTVTVEGDATTTTWYKNWTGSTLSEAVNWNNDVISSGTVLYGKISAVTHVENNNSTTSTTPFDINKTYIISVSPQSRAIYGNSALTKTSTLAQAFYLLVGKAGGHALGIGKKPDADEMLDIGMYTKINNSIDAGVYQPQSGQSQEFVVRLGGGAGTIYMYSQADPTTGKRGLSGIPSAGGNAIPILEVNQNNAVSLYGIYTFNGGQQPPNFFGTNRAGFLMSNATINGNSNYKNWIYMDCYNGNDVGGTTAFGIDRNTGRAFVMRADANRTSWNTTGELYSTLYKPTAADVGAVPTSRTINSKALSSDITLSASDVGAVPTSRTINGRALTGNINIIPTDMFIFDEYSKEITVGSGATSITMGSLTQRSGYTLIGYMSLVGGYGDQWLVSYSTYGSNVVAMVYSKYSTSLTQTIKCTAVWRKNS